MTLKGQCHYSKQMAPLSTIRFPDLKKIDLDTKIVILSALVQNLWSKASFCIMVANVTCSRMLHVQTAQIFWGFIKRP